MGKYNKLIITDLLSECSLRNIKDLPKGPINKQLLIALLEASDSEKKVLTPPTPTPKENTYKYQEGDVILLEDEEEENVKCTMLAVGASKNMPILVNKDIFMFTGIPTKEDILWKNLKLIQNGSLDKIIIFDYNPLIEDDTEYSSKLLLTLLKENGEVWLIKSNLEYRRGFVGFLKKNGYNKNSDNFIYIDGSKTNFEIYKKDNFSSDKSIDIFPQTSSNNPIPTEELDFEDSEPKKKRIQRTYKKYKLGDLHFSKKETNPSIPIKEGIPRISITLPEFILEIEKEVFITNFTISVEKLMKYKLTFYKIKITELKKEFDKLKRKVSELMKNGVGEKTIKEKYPLFDFYPCFILDLEDIVKTIIERLLSLNKENIKKSLKECIENQEKGLESLISRDEIKNSLVSQLYSFSKSYKTFTNSFNNICLLGNAGCGKTHAAKVISYVFSKSGILATDNVKIVSRADLVGQYIGQTAPRTQSILLQMLEGVLFIDEAYQLSPPDSEKSNDYGLECITEIVNFTDKYIGMSVVIVAGYENLMIKNFFKCNEGLCRRFPHRVILRDYTILELTDILVCFLENKDIEISEKIANYLFSMLNFLKNENSSVFSNQAGDMLNLGSSIEKCIHSSYKIKWSTINLKNNLPIIKEGFSRFLDTKGYEIMDMSQSFV